MADGCDLRGLPVPSVVAIDLAVGYRTRDSIRDPGRLLTSLLPELGQSYFAKGRNPARRAIFQYLERLHEDRALEVEDPEFAGVPSLERRKEVVEEAVRTFLCRYRISGV